jgi:hypothetical protein
MGVSRNDSLTVLSLEQVRHTGIHMVQARLAAVAPQVVLEDFVKLAEVVVVEGHFQGGEEGLSPLWRKARRLTAKFHTQPNDFAYMRPIGLLRRAVVGAVCQRLAHMA